MAHKKGQGSVRNGRDSNAKYLGVKKYAGETVKAGNIRQGWQHYRSSARFSLPQGQQCRYGQGLYLVLPR